MANKLFNQIFTNKHNEDKSFNYPEVYQERLEIQKRIKETLIKLEVCEFIDEKLDEKDNIYSICRRFKNDWKMGWRNEWNY